MKERKRRPFLLFLFLGPGMLAAMAGNDAGGVLSYTVTGAKFGWGVFVPMTLCLAFVTYTVQEMAMRLGVVSGRGYTRLLRERYGAGWTAVQVAALFAENLLTLLTEFVGMSAGLQLLGLPLAAAVLLSVGLVVSVAALSGQRAKERFGLAVGLFNVVFLVLALRVHPAVTFRQSAALASGRPFLWYTAALIGNAIAPWMIFYQNGAYADRGVKTRHIREGRADTLAGCVCQVLIASAFLVIGACVFGGVPGLENAGTPELVAALNAKLGPAAGALFALGLFDAGLLAAVTVSFSSSWSVAEALGWSGGPDDTVRGAPGFYGVYLFSAALAAVCSLVPCLRSNGVAVLVQVAGGVLMTPVLIFLTRLTSDPGVMGEYANSAGQKARAWLCVAALGAVTAFTVLEAVF